MQRTEKLFSINDMILIKRKVLIWSHQHNVVTWLDSNENNKTIYEGVLAVNKISHITGSPKNAFKKLKDYINSINDYAFGYLGYDLKNDTEKLYSNHIDVLEFPDLFFFQPEKIIEIIKDAVIFRYPTHLANEIESDWDTILKTSDVKAEKNSVQIQARISKDTYTKQINKALDAIHKGAVYELNFCQEFYGNKAKINPINTYLKLNELSKAPFATFFKNNHLFLLSASPERFLKKQGEHLVSEPIKGTAKREISLEEDKKQISFLQNNTKEIAENIMIVDLVRNDLSHIAQKGTVQVDSLCKIHSFKQVHQMISSISCNIKPEIHAVDAIKACYPMGSMTGAPKIAAMQIIEDLEFSKRGLYSGAIGYFTPEHDFDFNVVIRSILYNQKKEYVSFSVGSAITAKANPEMEYQECLLKAKAMREVLTQ